ncbi:MAG: D-glycero-beta-D-manno-heptose 1-phosphate adenylyltransferase [Candidatus Eisenbacteria bacterium]|nr:D-glycero-beta-D-manno-heptose 1-phosphate adenylyltransferase [Candidatus Eisenbacteria bacterium]
MGEVLSRSELARVCETERARDRRIVFTNGCFDILHRGHAWYLEKARALGDLLVVGVNSDRSVRELKGAGRPIVPEDDRAHLLAALESVDYVCIFDEPTPYELIDALRPDVLVKGAGYTRDTIVGADIVESSGGEVVAVEELPGRSTRSIIARVAESEGKDS